MINHHLNSITLQWILYVICVRLDDRSTILCLGGIVILVRLLMLLVVAFHVMTCCYNSFTSIPILCCHKHDVLSLPRRMNLYLLVRFIHISIELIAVVDLALLIFKFNFSLNYANIIYANINLIILYPII